MKDYSHLGNNKGEGREKREEKEAITFHINCRMLSTRTSTQKSLAIA